MKPTRARKIQELALRVLEARAVGGSISSISRDLGISTWKTRKALAHIGSELRESLLTNFVAERVPIAIAESLELNRIIIQRAMKIADDSKDPRVQIEALRLCSQVSSESAKILSDSHIISKAIQRSALVIHQQPTQQPAVTSEVVP